VTEYHLGAVLPPRATFIHLLLLPGRLDLLQARLPCFVALLAAFAALPVLLIVLISAVSPASDALG
jgi:hypothetical protein